MIKYIKKAGYQFKKDYNDLTDKQFTLESSSLVDSDYTTFNNIVLDRVDVYRLFVKNLELAAFQGAVMDILNDAISGGVDVTTGTAVEVENVENGYMITLTFTIKGK